MKPLQIAKSRVEAPKPLEQAVEGVLAGLSALEARLGGKTWISALLGPTTNHGAERPREVLDRDRALVSAGPPKLETPATSSPPTSSSTLTLTATATNRPIAPPCAEPIRTRTMARLLASQGHPTRALSIYDYLIAQGDRDESLHADADRLRAQLA